MPDPTPMPDALDDEPMEAPGAQVPVDPAPFPVSPDVPTGQRGVEIGDDEPPIGGNGDPEGDAPAVTTTDDLLGTPAGERSDDPRADPMEALTRADEASAGGAPMPPTSPR